MAQTILLKRSAVPGKIPTTSQLELSELSVNTYDGKYYFKRSSDDSIQGIVTTNSLTTGSINVSGSFLLTGSQYISDGSLDVGGNITLTNNMGVGGDLSVTGSTFISGNMTAVSGTFDYISASGDFVVDDIISDTGSFRYLNVSGDLVVDDITSDTGSFGYLDVSGDVVTAGDVVVGINLSVIGTTYVNSVTASSVSASSDSKFSGGIEVLGSAPSITNGGLLLYNNNIREDSGILYIGTNEAFGVQIYTNDTNAFLVGGDQNVSVQAGDFSVTGSTFLNGSTKVTGSLSVTNTAQIGNNVTIVGTDPYISLNDTSTGADHFLIGNDAGIQIRADGNNEVASSTIEFQIDGANTIASVSSTGLDVTGEISASGDLVTNGDILLSTNNNGLIGRATSNGQIDLIKINSSNRVVVGSSAVPTTINGTLITFAGSQVVSGSLTISGSLVVLGETIEAQVTELSIEDKIITVASGSVNGAASDGAGIEVDRGSDTWVSMSWDNANEAFEFNSRLGVRNTTTNNYYANFYTANGTGGVRFYDSNNSGDIYGFDSAGNNDYRFSANGVSFIKGGNFIVGGTSDQGQNFQVSGTSGFNGNVGVTGSIWVANGSSGATASPLIDDFVFEGSSTSNVGMSILGPDTSDLWLAFGTPTDPVGAKLNWDYTNNWFRIGAEKTGARTELLSGNGITALTADSDQQIGIGTTTPATLLHLSGSSSGLLRIESTNSSGPRLDFYTDASTRISSIEHDSSDGVSLRNFSSGADIYFLTNGGSGAKERVRINSSGNTIFSGSIIMSASNALGIGLSPSAPLDIQTNSSGYAIRIQENFNTGAEYYQLGVNSFGGLEIYNETTLVAEWNDSGDLNIQGNDLLSTGDIRTSGSVYIQNIASTIVGTAGVEGMAYESGAYFVVGRNDGNAIYGNRYNGYGSIIGARYSGADVISLGAADANTVYIDAPAGDSLGLRISNAQYFTLHNVGSASFGTTVAEAGYRVNIAGGLYVSSSVGGASVFKVEGTSGSLFEVVDSFDGVLMTVNDSSAVPIFIVSSSGAVGINKPNAIYDLDVNGTGSFTGDLYVSGNLSVLGDITLDDISSDTGSFGQVHATDWVGVGTTSTTSHGSEKLNVYRTLGDGNPIMTLQAGDGGASYLQIANSNTGTTNADGFFIGIESDESAMLYNRENTNMRFWTNGTERMRIVSSSGAVLIGTTSQTSTATELLRVAGDPGDERLVNIHRESSNGAVIRFSNTTTGTGANGFHIGINSSEEAHVRNREATVLWFSTADTERMRIASGSYTIGVGITDPSNWGSTLTAVQMGGGMALWGRTVDTNGFSGGLVYNAYSNGSNWVRKYADESSLYSIGANGVHIWSTAGSDTAGSTITWSERMRITNSGNLGVGTTSPSAMLHVSASGATNDLLVGTSKFIVDSLGNVGIGTTVPDEKLHVEGSVLIDAYTQGDGHGIFFREGFSSGSYNVSLTVRDWSNAGASPDGLLMSAFDGIGFMTGTNTYATSSIRMWIKGSTGQIGIGTIQPSYKLHVHGDINATGSVLVGNTAGAYMIQEIASGIGEIKMDRTTTLLRIAGGDSFNEASGSYISLSGIGNGGSATLAAGSTAGSIQFRAGGSQRAMITGSTGALLIGTTSATSHGGEALRVDAGNIIAANFHRTSASGTNIQFTNSDTGTTAGDGFLVGIDATEAANLINYESTPLIVYTAGTERFRVASNAYALGIGTTDVEAWVSTGAAIEFGKSAIYAQNTGNFISIGSNFYTDGVYKYKDANPAVMLALSGGEMLFRTAASGTADTTLTWSEKMRLTNSGSLLIGTASTTSHGEEGLRVQGTSGRLIDVHATGTGAASFIQFTNGDTGTTTNDGFQVGIDGNEAARLYNGESTPMQFYTAGTERMRIASGSYALAIGHTDVENWASGYGAIEFGRSAIMGQSNGDNFYIYNNIYFDGSERYKANGVAASFEIGTGAEGGFRWQTATSGVADAVVSLSEKMRLTNSGSLLIGTTSTTSHATEVLRLSSSGGDVANVHRDSSSAAYIQFTNTTTGTATTDGFKIGIAADETAQLANLEATAMGFRTADTERMRIASGSYALSVGTTTTWPWSGYASIDFQETAVVGQNSVGGDLIGFVSNAYYDGSWRAKTTGESARYSVNADASGNVFLWEYANSGTAGALINGGSGAWTALMQMNSSGSVFIGDTSNSNMTVGLTINQAGNTDEIFALKESTNVAHGLTSQAETDTWFHIKQANANLGGAVLDAFVEDNASAPIGLLLRSYGGQADTTKSTAARALVEVYASEHDGANNLSSITANGNVFAVRANVGGSTTLLIVDEDGDTWQTGGATFQNNVQVTGSINATGNISGAIISASVFHGDGGQLTGITASAAPAGTDGQVQYNNGGVAGGTTNLFYDDSNHYVGIRTTTPTAELTVSGSTNLSGSLFIAKSSGTSGAGLTLQAIADDSYVDFTNSGARKWSFWNDSSYSGVGTDVMRITGDGGLTDDHILLLQDKSTKFKGNVEVTGSLTTTGNISSTTGDITTADGRIRALTLNGNTLPSLRTYMSGHSGSISSWSAEAALAFACYQSDAGSPFTKTSAIVANSDGTVPSELEIWTKASGSSSPTLRTVITSTGNVGIGTSNPLGKLHVASTASGQTPNSGADELVLDNDGYSGVSILANSSSYSQILFGDKENATVGAIQYQHNNDKLSFRTNGVDSLSLDSGGDLALGTSGVNPFSLDRNLSIYDTTASGKSGLSIYQADGTNNVRAGLYVDDSELKAILNTTWTTGGLGWSIRTAGTERIGVDATGVRVTGSLDSSGTINASRTGLAQMRVTSLDGLDDAVYRFYSGGTFKGQIGWDQSADAVGIFNAASSTVPKISIGTDVSLIANTLVTGSLTVSGTISGSATSTGSIAHLKITDEINMGYPSATMVKRAGGGFYGEFDLFDSSGHTIINHNYPSGQFRVQSGSVDIFKISSAIASVQVTGSLDVSGDFSATTKSFLIDNPETGGKLRYGNLEGNEHAVYCRGKATTEVIDLPTEWKWLVDPDSITVQLTSANGPVLHWFRKVKNNKVYIDSETGIINCFYLIHATRADVPKLEVNQ